MHAVLQYRAGLRALHTQPCTAQPSEYSVRVDDTNPSPFTKMRTCCTPLLYDGNYTVRSQDTLAVHLGLGQTHLFHSTRQSYPTALSMRSSARSRRRRGDCRTDNSLLAFASLRVRRSPFRCGGSPCRPPSWNMHGRTGCWGAPNPATASTEDGYLSRPVSSFTHVLSFARRMRVFAALKRLQVLSSELAKALKLCIGSVSIIKSGRIIAHRHLFHPDLDVITSDLSCFENLLHRSGTSSRLRLQQQPHALD